MAAVVQWMYLTYFNNYNLLWHFSLNSFWTNSTNYIFGEEQLNVKRKQTGSGLYSGLRAVQFNYGTVTNLAQFTLHMQHVAATGVRLAQIIQLQCHSCPFQHTCQQRSGLTHGSILDGISRGLTFTADRDEYDQSDKISLWNKCSFHSFTPVVNCKA